MRKLDIVIEVRNDYSRILKCRNREAVYVIRTCCQMFWTSWTRDRSTGKSVACEQEASLFDIRKGVFPTGLLFRICDMLTRRGIGYALQDLRYPTGNELLLPAISGLRDYQIEGSDSAVKKKRGIVWYPTGSGKTLTAAATIQKVGRDTLYIVPNKTLLVQTHDALVKIFSQDVVGMVGGGNHEYTKPIIVATAQMLWKNVTKKDVKTLLARVGMVIVDECHHVSKSPARGGNTWFKLLMKSDAYYRIGFSGTPGKDGEVSKMMLESATGPIIAEIQTRELVERGILPDPEIVIYENYVPTMNLPSLTKSKAGKFNLAYKHNLLKNKKRNQKIRDIAREEVLAGRTVLISVERIETQGKILQNMLPEAEFLQGSSSSKKRKSVIAALSSKKLGIVIGTILGEGVDIPSLDTLIVAGGLKSEKLTIQRAGRALRGDSAKVIDFYDNDRDVLARHSKARVATYLGQEFKVTIIRDSSAPTALNGPQGAVMVDLDETGSPVEQAYLPHAMLKIRR